MFGFRFWQALFEGKRWARRQLLEAVVVLVVCGVVIEWVVIGRQA